jgi:carbon storage regulator
MLVLSRRTGKGTVIDGQIAVKVLEVRGSRVRLGIQAPQNVIVMREELLAEDPRADGLRRRDAAEAASIHHVDLVLDRQLVKVT